MSSRQVVRIVGALLCVFWLGCGAPTAPAPDNSQQSASSGTGAVTARPATSSAGSGVTGKLNVPGSAARVGSAGNLGTSGAGNNLGTGGASNLGTSGAGSAVHSTAGASGALGAASVSSAGAGAVAAAGGGATTTPTDAVEVHTAADPKLPEITGDCPPFAEGTNTMDFMGLKGVIFDVGPKANGTGSLVFYWHGTGSTSGEYMSSTMQAAVMMDLRAKGGIVVSPQSGTGTGPDCSGTGTFYQDDFKIADQIAACAVRDWNIDPHRIYSTGCSAGGLMAGCMAMLRSSYLAAAVPNSGGLTFPGSVALADKSHVPSMMTIHGMMGDDVVIVDFSQTSGYIDDAIKAAGGFAVDCDHHGGHCGLPVLPPEVATAGWKFMQDHPFGVSPEPYSGGLPADFPMYCKIW